MPRERQRGLPTQRGRGVTYMVSSAILNETAVTDECGVKKGACLRFPAASYMYSGLTRGDKMVPRVPGNFPAEGLCDGGRC